MTTQTPAIHVTAVPLFLTCSITAVGGMSSFFKATTEGVNSPAKDTAVTGNEALVQQHQSSPVATVASCLQRALYCFLCVCVRGHLGFCFFLLRV